MANRADKLQRSVVVYPVLVRDGVWVRYHADAKGGVTLQLINEAARAVLLQVHPVVAGENRLRVGVSNLPRGL